MRTALEKIVRRGEYGTVGRNRETVELSANQGLWGLFLSNDCLTVRHTTRLVVVDENLLSFIIQAAAKRDNQFRKLETKIMATAIKAI